MPPVPLEAVADRLSGSGSQLSSVLRLDINDGGGKTYGQIGLNHALTSPEQIAHFNPPQGVYRSRPSAQGDGDGGGL